MRADVLDGIKALRYAWGYAKAPIVLGLTVGAWSPGVLMIGRAPAITNRGTMQVGRGVVFRSSVQRSAISTGRHGTLVIGDDTFLNEGVHLHAEDRIDIGRRVDIGDGVRIYDTNFHPVKPGAQTRTEPLVIEDDVWIGVDAVLLPGARVGRGAVIGARCVVNRPVAPGEVLVAASPESKGTFDVPAEFRRRRVRGAR